MSPVKKKSNIDKDYQPLFNRLLSPFPEDYYAEDVIVNYWKKYIVQDAWRYIFEMYLRVQGKTNNLKASIEDLHEFMEDTSDLLMAVYVSSEEKKMSNRFEKLIEEKVNSKEMAPFSKLFSSPKADHPTVKDKLK